MSQASRDTLTLFMPIILAVVAGLFAILRIWAEYQIQKRFKDAALAAQLSNAVNNAVGMVQQGVEKMLGPVDPRIMPNLVPPHLIPGVQYVLNNAAPAVKRYEQSPSQIAEKITAQIGLKEIDTNIAVSASAATPVVAAPLDPVEVTIAKVENGNGHR